MLIIIIILIKCYSLTQVNYYEQEQTERCYLNSIQQNMNVEILAKSEMHHLHPVNTGCSHQKNEVHDPNHNSIYSCY